MLGFRLFMIKNVFHHFFLPYVQVTYHATHNIKIHAYGKISERKNGISSIPSIKSLAHFRVQYCCLIFRTTPSRRLFAFGVLFYTLYVLVLGLHQHVYLLTIGLLF